MSGGQRKRVTFADLVTARLPSTTPQQTPDPRPSETVAASSSPPPSTGLEQPTDLAAISQSTHYPGSPDNREATPSVPDIHLAPA